VVPATSLTTINNIIAVTQSGPVGDDRLFRDIVTAEDLHALIMSSFSSDEYACFNHFIMTPIDVIEPG